MEAAVAAALEKRGIAEKLATELAAERAAIDKALAEDGSLPDGYWKRAHALRVRLTLAETVEAIVREELSRPE